MIPVRNKDGLIQGMKIRLDDADSPSRKYRWLSSRDLPNGTRSYSYIHVTGDTTKKRAFLTEGPLKRDVASYLAHDALFVCVGGVNAIHGLKDTLMDDPAFLFLDFDVENAAFFLQKVTSNILLRPIPYILIAGTFLKGSDRAAMFDLGADACIEKPIDPSEVSAVIHAVLRHERKISRLNTGRLRSPIEHKNLIIDPMRQIVTMCGEPVELSPKEFDVLCLLAEHAGVVIAPQTIYEAIWKSGFEFSNTRVADNICSIRQKLKLSKNDTDYIQTIFRVGYRFAQEE